MNIPDNLRYTRDHEWAEINGDRVRVGITDFAQDALGDIVFVNMAQPGTSVQMGMSFGEVESTKSVSDVYAPITGVVVEANGDLAESPQYINEDPYGRGWICVIESAPDATVDHLLEAQSYRDLVDG